MKRRLLAAALIVGAAAPQRIATPRVSWWRGMSVRSVGPTWSAPRNPAAMLSIG